ncbi:hypothetical protein D3C78_1204450 [compost metagenome]
MRVSVSSSLPGTSQCQSRLKSLSARLHFPLLLLLIWVPPQALRLLRRVFSRQLHMQQPLQALLHPYLIWRQALRHALR